MIVNYRVRTGKYHVMESEFMEASLEPFNDPADAQRYADLYAEHLKVREALEKMADHLGATGNTVDLFLCREARAALS